MASVSILLILVSIFSVVSSLRISSFTNHKATIAGPSFNNKQIFRRKLWMTAASSSPVSTKGKVCLVGAGPGDPDLLTVQALKRIQTASLVISDRLVSKEILQLVKGKLKIANKKPGCAEEAQDELNRWVIDAVLQGEDVVRLKIGDPFLFGRAGEEILEYRKHNIETIVLPGLSSSYTAPLVANIPLTHRGVANQVLITTGYGMNGTHIDLPHFHPDRTLVLLMAVGRIEEITHTLLNKEYPEHTPIAIIEKATTPDQRILEGTLHNIIEIAKIYEAKAPATIVIGEVVSVLQNHPLPVLPIPQ